VSGVSVVNNMPVHLNYSDKDDFATPLHVWDSVVPYLPRTQKIWEPFYFDGTSGAHLTKLGFDVHHEPNEDFFEHDHGDIIVSNPPFSCKREVFKRLKELGKPFMMLVPMETIATAYFRELFPVSYELSLLIPRRRTEFVTAPASTSRKRKRSNCPFFAVFVCWRMPTVPRIAYLQ
jgi:hypothetical protein